MDRSLDRRRRGPGAGFRTLVVLVVAGVVASGYVLGAVDCVRLLRQNARTRAEIARWREANDKLRQELKVVSSNEFVEKVARQELGLIRPDEKLYVVTQPGSGSGESVRRRPSGSVEIGD